jgi:Tol biopolymer transport system component
MIFRNCLIGLGCFSFFALFFGQNSALGMFPNGTLCSTNMVSQHPWMGMPDLEATSATLSADGKIVALASAATNLVFWPQQDTNMVDDVYVYEDIPQPQMTLISSDPQQNAGNGRSWNPSMSSDGRFIAFESLATNLGGNAGGIFLYDKLSIPNHITRIDSGVRPSVSDNGNRIAYQSSIMGSVSLMDRALQQSVILWSGNSRGAQISGDGNWALVLGYPPGGIGVYLLDLRTFPNIPPALTIAVEYGGASISADGTKIALSTQQALVPDDINGRYDVYVWDSVTRKYDRITAFEYDPSSSMHQSTEQFADAYSPKISRNGRFVAFQTFGVITPNDAPVDTGGYKDVFVYDRFTKLIQRSSRTQSWELPPYDGFGVSDETDFTSRTENTNVPLALTMGPILSDDGLSVAFLSDVNQFFAGLTGSLSGASQIYRDVCPSFQVQTMNVSCAGDGIMASCPTGNLGLPGRGCANSQVPEGAKLEGWGIASVSSGNFKLVVTGLPLGTSAGVYEMNGTPPSSGYSPLGGDGRRCVDGQANLIRVASAIPNRTVHFGPGMTAFIDFALTAQAFQVKTYQVIYRNPAPGFGTSESYNWTNSITVTWMP